MNMKRCCTRVTHLSLLIFWCSLSFGNVSQSVVVSEQQGQKNLKITQSNDSPGKVVSNSGYVSGRPSSMVNPVGQIDTTSLVKPDNWNCLLYATYFNFWRLEVVITSLSTYRLHNCSPNGLDKITVASASAQLRTVTQFNNLVKGGAHQNVMSVNLTPIDKEYYSVSDLKFSQVGIVRVNLKTLLTTTYFSGHGNLHGISYRPFVREGKNHYIWNMGTLVYRLVSPEGDTYLMTAFTNEVSPTLTREKLVYLGPMLNLPDGWVYQSYFLDKTITVRAGPDNNNSIVVISDDLRNSYAKYQD
jgi:hypothetical protein